MRRLFAILLILLTLANPAWAADWYVNYGDGSTTGYYAVPVYATGVKAAGALCRQLTTPAVGSERVYVCTTGGTGTAEPTWTTTKGAIQASDNGVIWQECTGQSAVNGDVTNTLNWTTGAKSTTPALGFIIKNDAATYYFICTVSGAAGTGSEPTWDTTAGNPTTDASATWVCLGAVGGFSAWGAPIPRLATAFTATWGTAGDRFFVGDIHAETQTTSMTLTSPGTAASPCEVLCVDDAVAPPTTLATTATVTTTGASNLVFAGFAHCYGGTFSASTGLGGAPTYMILFNSTSPWMWEFSGCKLYSGRTTQGGNIQVGSGGATSDNCLLILNNTKVGFASANNSIRLAAPMIWKNTPSALTDTVSTTLFDWQSVGLAGSATLSGVDLSAAGSGKNLVNAAANVPMQVKFTNCKLGNSVAITTGSFAGPGGVTVEAINCASDSTNYAYYKNIYQGTSTSNATIVRSGGATDGTTPQSRWLSTTANSKKYSPLYSSQVVMWNETTGSGVTVAIPFITFGSTPVEDDDIWIEAQALTTSGYPLSVITTDRGGDALNDSTADQATDTSTWTATARANTFDYSVGSIMAVQGKVWICTADTGSSAASEPAGYATAVDGDSITDGNNTFRAAYRQKASVSVTPTLKGIISARLAVAIPSTEVYYDPMILGSSGRQFTAAPDTYLNEAVQAGGAASYSRSRVVNQ